MNMIKVAITMDKEILNRLDQLVKNRKYKNRSRAIQEAVSEKLSKMNENILARECAKLDPEFEQSMAEEGFHVEKFDI